MAVLEARRSFLNGRRAHLLNKLASVGVDIGRLTGQLKSGLEPNRVRANRNLLVSKNQTVRRIKDALDRIVNGTYGICLQCRRPINEERILTIPEAELCTPCHRLNERRR